MQKKQISDRLAEGKPAIVLSTPFSISQLREMARAALRGATTLTIVVDPNHRLNDIDIDNITDEAPSCVVIDYTRCKF